MNINDIKLNNRKRIYLYIREHRQATKQDIAHDLKLSLPTVTQNLAFLIEQGLVSCHHKVISQTGGRNPVAYGYIPDARVAVGLDLSRHHIKSIVIDLDGQVIQSVSRRQEYQRHDDYLKQLGAEVANILSVAALDPGKVLGVGIAVPGLVDPVRQCVVDGRVIDNTGMTLAEFSKFIPFPTRLIHDTIAAGFSEIIHSPGLHNACYLSLCASIGGSVIANDKTYLGDGLYSCEFGHLNRIPNGKLCYCGQKGCFDPYCNSEVLSQHTQGSLLTFFERLAAGDQTLGRIWDDYLDHLATLITEIRMMFGSSIIIGGEIGVFIDPYLQSLCDKVDVRSPFGEKSSTYLQPCNNKLEAIATGAALHFIQEYLEQT